MNLSFLKTLFDSRAREAARLRKAEADAAVEKVVDGTDPRLRLVRGYRKQLGADAMCTLAHARALAEQLSGAIEVSKKAFGSDPRVRALFVSVDHLRDVFGQSSELREYMTRPEHQESDACYALLAVEMTEKQVFGMEMQGDMIKKEVLQKAISFGGHRLVMLASDPDTLERELIEGAFQHVVGSALRRIVSLKTQSAELGERRRLLERKLQGRLAKKRGLEEALFATPEFDGEMTMAIRHELADADEQLAASKASLGTLNDYLSQIRQVLAHPAEYIALDQITVRLDPTGVPRPPGPGEPGEDVSFWEVKIGEDHRAVGVPVKFSSKELPPRQPPRPVLDF